MKKYSEFSPANRYLYDFGLCSTKNGFAQVDTRQDASYFGNWANPFRLVIFSYVEGDCYTTDCDNLEEFSSELRKIKEFHGEDFLGLDPGFNEDLKQGFIDAGLGDMLH